MTASIVFESRPPAFPSPSCRPCVEPGCVPGAAGDPLYPTVSIVHWSRADGRRRPCPCRAIADLLYPTVPIVSGFASTVRVPMFPPGPSPIFFTRFRVHYTGCRVKATRRPDVACALNCAPATCRQAPGRAVDIFGVWSAVFPRRRMRSTRPLGIPATYCDARGRRVRSQARSLRLRLLSSRRRARPAAECRHCRAARCPYRATSARDDGQIARACRSIREEPDCSPEPHRPPEHARVRRWERHRGSLRAAVNRAATARVAPCRVDQLACGRSAHRRRRRHALGGRPGALERCTYVGDDMVCCQQTSLPARRHY